MKQIAEVTLFSLLTGVHTIYIAENDFNAKRDITRALKSELPDVRVVLRASEADVVMELRGSLPRVAYVRPPVVTVQQPHITFASSSGQIQQNVSPRAIRNPEADQP